MQGRLAVGLGSSCVRRWRGDWRADGMDGWMSAVLSGGGDVREDLS